MTIKLDSAMIVDNGVFSTFGENLNLIVGFSKVIVWWLSVDSDFVALLGTLNLLAVDILFECNAIVGRIRKTDRIGALLSRLVRLKNSQALCRRVYYLQV